MSDTGGVLSHLSIIGREFGIPTIVNCQDAITAIPGGARIRVDADAGEVTVLR